MRLKATDRLLFFLCCTLTAALWAPPAFGHYLWVDGSGETYRVNRGHTPETLHPYPPAAVTTIRPLTPTVPSLPLNG